MMSRLRILRRFDMPHSTVHMKQAITRIPVGGSLTLLVVGAAAIAVALSGRRTEVTVCRETVRGLIDGSPRVGRSIGWERLQAMGVDVGATYRRLPNERDRSEYRQAFIGQFREGFRRAHGQADGFRHWRVQQRLGERVIVAADYTPSTRPSAGSGLAQDSALRTEPAGLQPHHRTLMLTVPASGPKKVEKMDWVSQ